LLHDHAAAAAADDDGGGDSGEAGDEPRGEAVPVVAGEAGATVAAAPDDAR